LALHVAGGVRHVFWKMDSVHWAQPLTAVALVALVVWWWTAQRAQSSFS
jgi:hypothetical protein